MASDWLEDAQGRLTKVTPPTQYAFARMGKAVKDTDGARDYMATLAAVVMTDTPHAYAMLNRARRIIGEYGRELRRNGWITASEDALDWEREIKGGPQDGGTGMAEAGSDGHAIEENPVGDRETGAASRGGGPGSVPDQHP